MELPRNISRKTAMGIVMLAALLPAISGQGCGLFGQSCCTDLAGQRTSCNAGLWCDVYRKNTCQYFCGSLGQPCCGNNYCNSGFFCEAGAGADPAARRCSESCGQAGRRCCRNFVCSQGFSCNGALMCVSGGVRPRNCGNFGQRCCGGDTCVAGTYCDTSSKPGMKMCRRYCGSLGQPCCQGKKSGDDGCGGLGSISFCDDKANNGTGMCTNFCGEEGQPCCPRGNCGVGLSCSNAICEKTRNNCGAINAGCCLDGACALGSTCEGGVCKQSCGLTGEKCCSSPPNWCAKGLSCGNSMCAVVTTAPAPVFVF